ncbi:seryl-tRNA synthetase [Nonlabens dokdonensis]|jgi:seryl-tRNA synthetase|uniref:Serine--tRNA ligase n=2 Tax=Nonlabens dokdonensis TaxID=328515 RepID=L7WB33_NONDD|nr:serine--tRNA ligase [Nonlabens dokdonensis]AGC76123.1 seryl-tRNA synthetase [Nonlabens dokdonensis DSW-6]PZX43794.1 seryl-tRNA synthetase [Nonlabens dokdonensis]
MLQIAEIRENKDVFAKALQKRNIDALPLLENAIKVDEQRRSIQGQLDETLAKSNKLSKEIGELYKSGKAAEANELKKQTADLKESSKQLGDQLNEAVAKLQTILYEIPNIPQESVPAGNTDEDNEVVSQHGEIPVLHEEAKPHWELVKDYDIIDFELGNKITGAGFPVYKNKGARLQRALINYFLDKNTEAGYDEMQVPHLVNEASGYGTGQLPDKEGQMYHVGVDDLYLIPTGEVPITNIYRDTILEAKDFPITMTGYTPCFRREAGSYGSDVRGLNRLHQFDKVEILRIEHPDKSDGALDAMVVHVKGILEELELPYRILRLCGGDLGFTSTLTYDFEVYSTAQEKWLEVSSVSNFKTFQANRLKLRYRAEKGTELAHTLNGSALALPRILASILENYQVNGGIKIPKVLIPYCGFDTID